MEFFDVVQNRHSIRSYSSKEVEEDKIKKILGAANSAPSAGNLQAYEIFVIRDKEKKNKIAKAAGEQEFVAEAPIVLVFCAHPQLSRRKYGHRGEDLYSLQDATIAVAYSQLAAAALGLGCVWVGAFDENEVLRILEKKDLRPVAILPIGYPNEEPEIRQRRELKDIVHDV